MEKSLILEKLRDLKTSLMSDTLDKEQLIIEFRRLIELYFNDTSKFDNQMIILKDKLKTFIELEALKEKNKLLKSENEILRTNLLLKN